MSLLENLKNLDHNIDTLVREYLDLQIACMLLYYAAEQRSAQGDVHNSKVIISFAEYMREALQEMHNNYEQSLGKEELEKTLIRIGRDKILYSALNDAAIVACRNYFPVASRPVGIDYVCDNITCNQNADIQLQKYFDFV